MSPVENYTTKIGSTRTAGEIQELLADHGVQRIGIEYDAGRPTSIAFEVTTEVGPQAFRLPVDVDAMHHLLKAEKAAGRLPGISAALAQDRTQAERVAWRVVYEWLRAQMTLIASRMATIDQVMLPYLVTDDGRTLYVAWREQGLRELTRGVEGHK